MQAHHSPTLTYHWHLLYCTKARARAGSDRQTSRATNSAALVQVAIQEARRLQRFGVTQAEADTYRQATLRDNFMASMQADYVPAQEILEFLMETLATRGVFSDNQQVQARLGAFPWFCPCLISICSPGAGFPS